MDYLYSFFQLLQLWIKKTHSCGIFLGFVVNRHKYELCYNSKENYSNAVVVYQSVDPAHKVSERDTDDIVKTVQF